MKVVVAFVATATAIALSACVGTPHHSPEEVSGAEVSIYKTGIGMGCRNQGKSLGDNAAEQRCKCIVDALESRMSADEWRRATFFSQQRRDRDEAAVLAPHMAATRQCK